MRQYGENIRWVALQSYAKCGCGGRKDGRTFQCSPTFLSVRWRTITAHGNVLYTELTCTNEQVDWIRIQINPFGWWFPSVNWLWNYGMIYPHTIHLTCCCRMLYCYRLILDGFVFVQLDIGNYYYYYKQWYYSHIFTLPYVFTTYVIICN